MIVLAPTQLAWAVLERSIYDLTTKRHSADAIAWLHHEPAVVSLKQVQELIGLSDDAIRIIQGQATAKGRLDTQLANRLCQALWDTYRVSELIREEEHRIRAMLNQEANRRPKVPAKQRSKTQR